MSAKTWAIICDFKKEWKNKKDKEKEKRGGLEREREREKKREKDNIKAAWT